MSTATRARGHEGARSGEHFFHAVSGELIRVHAIRTEHPDPGVISWRLIAGLVIEPSEPGKDRPLTGSHELVLHSHAPVSVAAAYDEALQLIADRAATALDHEAQAAKLGGVAPQPDAPA